MTDELLTLDDLASMYRCSRRHARDVIAKGSGFPELAPGSTQRNPLWLRVEIRAYLRRKTQKTRTNPELLHATLGC
jgi:hypothetical protein